ncbi:MAG: hypothetical protein VX971_00045 [Actinomycetota bacterium]|nr:hypothetical protein [Actinomycetota bacterium]
MAKESSGCAPVLLLVAFLAILLGGCIYVMECAGGTGMSGMPSSDFCDRLP